MFQIPVKYNIMVATEQAYAIIQSIKIIERGEVYLWDKEKPFMI